MGIFHEARQDIGNLRIAMPDEAISAGRIVFKWPEKSIRKFTKAFVPEGYCAVFVNQGQVIGQLSPGEHTIDAQELPVIGVLLDRLFYDNAYRCELIFFRTAECRDLRFGGPFDRIKEPDFQMPVEIRCYGDYSLRVFDGGLMIKTVLGTADQPDNEVITNFVGRQIMRVMGEIVVDGVLNRTIPVLGIKSQQSEIMDATIGKVNPELAENGLQLVRFGDFTINVKDEDFERLSALSDKVAEKRAMIGLASDPGYAAYAQGQVLEGAGQGLAQGGGGANTTAFLGMGMNMGQMVGGAFGQPGQQQQPQGYPPPPASGGPVAAAPAMQVACASCQTPNAAGAKFCANCGTAMPQAKFCASCGTSLAPGAKFCADCGTPTAGPPADASPSNA